jgi:BolA family transcriptional regulator, general stress-responsive regulator
MGSLWDRQTKKQENVLLDTTDGSIAEWRMTMAETIRQKLTTCFTPTELAVEDESAKHAGHSGARPGGETHFNVRIVADSFAGLSRVERQRRVYAVLAEELRGSLHALSVTTLTPAEMWQEH